MHFLWIPLFVGRVLLQHLEFHRLSYRRLFVLLPPRSCVFAQHLRGPERILWADLFLFPLLYLRRLFLRCVCGSWPRRGRLTATLVTSFRIWLRLVRPRWGWTLGTYRL